MANITANITPPSFRPVYDSFLVILAVCIITINLIVIHLFVQKDYLRTKTNCFLVSLAVSDLMTSLLSIPFYLLCPLTNPQVCIVSACSYRIVANSTMAHIMVVTLERYIAVMYPMRYYRVVTKRRVCVCISLVWFFAVTFSLIPLILIDFANHSISNYDPKVREFDKRYNVISLVLWFAIPLCVMVYCFSRMFVVIRWQVRVIRRQAELAADPRNRSIASDKRALVIFASMLTIFAVCWSTWYVNLFQVEFGPNAIFPVKLADVLDFLRFGTSLVNPMLYTFLKNDFRRAFCSLFTSCCIKNRVFKPRRDSSAFRMTLSTDVNANGKQCSNALLKGVPPGQDNVNELAVKDSQDVRRPENIQLVSHV